jgi:GntR family carbon starvation induced transcriptional regulator
MSAPTRQAVYALSDRHSSDLETLSARAARTLERDILSGVLPPGARLGITDLVRRYKIGATPIREGLSRLVSRGLITAVDQRGFRVSLVSREDLDDIIVTRITIECEALRRSMTLGNDEWEAVAIAAFHRLKYSIERAQPHRPFVGEQFETLHKSFHTALIAGCGSARLLALHSDLYDKAARYRSLAEALCSDRQSFIAEHKSLLDLAIARDAEAISRLSVHLGSVIRIAYPKH